MILRPGADYSCLYSLVVSPTIASRLDSARLVNAVIAAFNAEGAVCNNTTNAAGTRLCSALRSEQTGLFTPDRATWDVLITLRPTRDLDTARLDDVFASQWNTQFAGGGAIPTTAGAAYNASQRPGVLFARCSQFMSRQASTNFLGAINPWATPNYFQVCSQYTTVNVARVTVGPSSTAGRLISSPVTDASDPALVGTNPNRSTGVGGVISDAASSVGNSISSALSGGESGMNVNDLKVLIYGVGFLAGAVVVVKLIKEVKGI